MIYTYVSIETAVCTNGYLTYRHGELVTEPKACNMCLCLYGEIVCQEPECPKVKTGCRKVKYDVDFGNCCGEIVCGNSEYVSISGVRGGCGGFKPYLTLFAETSRASLQFAPNEDTNLFL